MEIIAFVATIIIGFAAESALGSLNFGWQSGGAVFAIAVMGTFILWAVRHKRSKQFPNGKTGRACQRQDEAAQFRSGPL